MIGVVVLGAAVLIVGWLVAWMLSQKPATSAERLIREHRYADAAAEAEKQRDPMHRGEALKLLGRFDEAIAAYRKSNDPSAAEGIALALTHGGGDLDEAKRLMETTIAQQPQIQEFQALALAYILLRRGEREEALRLFDDNVVLLQTRFTDDYTDPDPLLAETLWMFAELSAASGDDARAAELHARAAAWAPGSVWSTTPAPSIGSQARG
jgi:tetratricopeptide (TPR) repeat protein